MSKIRKSPSDSATDFDIGTIKLGNDNKKWIVKQVGKSQKWVPHKENPYVEKGIIKFNSKGNYTNDIGYVNIKELMKVGKFKFKKIQEINITSTKIGIGEIYFQIFPAVKGKYFIYGYLGSYIFCPENIDIEDLIFSDYLYEIFSDIGQTSIINVDKVKNEIIKFPSRKKSSKKLFTFDSEIDYFGIYSEKKRYALLTGKQFNYENSKEVFGVFLDNLYGDGSFQLLINKKYKSYMTISPDFISKFIDTT